MWRFGLLVACAFFLDQSASRPTSGGDQDEPVTEYEAIERLKKVFGLPERPPAPKRHFRPPQYMLDLYNTISAPDGIVRFPNPLSANVVRSFPDKDVLHRSFFFFNVSSVSVTENVLDAELHLFKVRPRYTSKFMMRRQHFYEVRVYQIMAPKLAWQVDGNRLVSSRLIGLHGSGWEVFNIKPAVQDWVADKNANFGLLVTIASLTGSSLDQGLIRFAKRKEHHRSKEPILVLFSDDGRPRSASAATYESMETSNIRYCNGEDYDYYDSTSTNQEILNNYYDPSPDTQQQWRNERTNTVEKTVIRKNNRTRVERAAQRYKTNRQFEPCTRRNLYVDFDAIGWSGWIISPKGYNAYHCKGKCPFPLGQSQKPTNHATVQSIMNALRLQEDVGQPCCVPNKLYSINLLYFDDEENVILKQYDDMVAANCGCH
ncbi:bone morphogenetic protein 2-like [Branchiostoma floridae]|uniref:Bone morphogenetic protein 2-like n=1 Tax=Branchiostoma floridae TaxID=7739 RepID=A0A9J7KTS2_BRAFL|nr:bone morphogenetic protein 2-like [Branchiostoma floridae]